MSDLNTDANDPVSQDAYAASMRAIVQPVGLVTAAQGEKWGGLTAVTICSATMDPPTLVVCVKHQSSVAEMIAESGAYAVNFLSESQASIARQFSDHGAISTRQFSVGHWFSAVTGAPLLKDSISAFDCEVVNVVRSNSHTLFLGRVVSTTSHGGDALMYKGGYFRRLSVGD